MKGRSRILLVVLAGLALALPAAATAGSRDTALETGVLQEINAVRQQHGLAALTVSAKLTAAAVQHSTEMGADGYFAHESVDKSAFWKRLQRWYPNKGWHYWTVGENLLWSSPDVSPSSAIEMWMNSPEHRANLLSKSWHEIGLSAVHFDAAPGAYGDQPVTIVTADFGNRQ
jgi:uncharacterized protein YkwD